MKVLFLIAAPLNTSPGQRFRIEHYLPLPEKNEITYSLQFWDSLSIWKRIFNNRHLILKSINVLKAILVNQI